VRSPPSRVRRASGIRSPYHLPVRRLIIWMQLSSMLVLSTASCVKGVNDRATQLRAESLASPFRELESLAVPKRAPAPRDWLARHPEQGQSVEDFIAQRPLQPAPANRTIDLLPIGDFDVERERLIVLTADYLEQFFGRPVRIRPTVPRDSLPAHAGRYREDLRRPQLNTRYVLDEVLAPRERSDAFALLALTSEDLYPDSAWNFVFGQASPTRSNGVWSLYRFGDPSDSPQMFRKCLLRTLKTASHELGHVLGIQHCIAYECLMNGSNHLEELDRRPFDLCPPCLQKLCWRNDVQPLDRAQRLSEFFVSHGLVEEAATTEKSLKAMRQRSAGRLGAR
jgi:archaemetzincin